VLVADGAPDAEAIDPTAARGPRAAPGQVAGDGAVLDGCGTLVVDRAADPVAAHPAPAGAAEGLVAPELTVAEVEGREAHDDGFGAGIEDPAAPAGTSVCASATLATRGLVVGERAMGDV
jgi:hypothetical protein